MISLKIASKRLKNMDFSLYLRLSLSVKCHHFLKTDITLHTYTTLLILAMAVCACSCHSSKQTQQTQLTEIPAPVDGITETPAPIKPGTTVDVPEYSVIFKADDVYLHNVPVSVTPSGGAVIYIPAPSAIKSQPVRLADGYWLAPIPLTRQSQFTDYTYEAYAKLTEAPSASEVMHHLIPDARPTTIVHLPVAASDTAAINRLIREGLPDCKTIK